jgi:site-specific DNA recombinase
MRAVIYARYSSDLQREASIEDQIEVCRRYVEAQGWTTVGTYRDAAISGASRFRPGFQKLIRDAGERQFDVVVCEAIDRLGRRLADTADLQDQLAFQGIRLCTPALGEITHIHVAVMGMMAQMALKDLAEKTKRGQLGRVLKGRIPAGIAYGYKAADGGGDGREGSIPTRRLWCVGSSTSSPRARVPRRSRETSIAKVSRGQQDVCGRTRRCAVRSTVGPGF